MTNDGCDTSAVVPFWLPGILAFFSATVRGVSGFGDGITFQAFFQLSLELGLVHGYSPSAACWMMRKAVLYSTIMQTMTMPLQVYYARTHLRLIMWYTIPMILLGSSNVVVGAWILLNGGTGALKVWIGAFFFLFSSFFLGSKSWRFLSSREQNLPTAPEASAQGVEGGVDEEKVALKGGGREGLGAGVHVDSSSIDDTASLVDSPRSKSISSGGSGRNKSPESHCGGSEQGGEEEGEGLERNDGGSSDEGEGARGFFDEDLDPWVPPLPSSSELYEGRGLDSEGGGAGGGNRTTDKPPQPWLPVISPAFSPTTMLLMLLPAAAAAGLLGGMTGAGGPPLMVVYSLLQLDKDVLRGFGVVPSVDMLVRLAMYTGSEESVFDPSGDAWHYSGILLGAVAGIVLGTSFRKRVSSEGVVVVILALVFCASALMLDVGQERITTLVYAFECALWGGFFGLCLLYPPAFTATRNALRCRAESSQK